ncbi:putative porin [Tamlana sp. I1]|uniref:putative porin n=1 Tax=Tamlana sp. I1 TaxID=2762061 RepID=UPI00188E1BB9|nr:putative porin [Tamlana sp. I1]
MPTKLTAFLFFIFTFCLTTQAQEEATKNKKLSFSGDFRFRVEQDWDSRKSDGTYREDRTRLRYRARVGVRYDYNENFTFGLRIRTGNPLKQQDPQLTLGDNYKEFGLLPIGFEKAYANFSFNWFSAWVGKNTFPFQKINELFWSDNVFPEGVALKGKFAFKNKLIESLQINTGHFIIATNKKALAADSYFEGFQLVTTHLDNRIKLFPAFYYFNDIPNIPDGNDTFKLNYAIVDIGAQVEILKKQKLKVGFDYYQNITNLESNDSIPQKFKNQKKGIVTTASIGELKKKGHWKFLFTYTYLERYAAVDFMAQNDWARWDYSSQGSPDGRLTNFKGFELMMGYALAKNMNLKMRFFGVDQLVPLDAITETGNRVRLDFNIQF